MSLNFRSRKVDVSVERLICTGLIVSDKVLGRLSSILKPEMMTDRYSGKIVEWCLGYYSEFEKAPKRHIRDLFEIHRGELFDDEVGDLIEEFLEGLDSEFAGKDLQEDYILSEAEKYVKSRSAQILCDDVKALVGNKRLDDAEEKIANYTIPQLVSAQGADVFSDDFWDVHEDESEMLFRYPGALDELIGPIMRDSFIAFLAPEKTGKCVHKDSLVMLADGTLKPIWQVVRDKDTQVMSYDEQQKRFVVGQVTDWWDNGEKECLAVYFKSGRCVRVTPNHPFLTPRGWVSISEVGIGGFVANPKQIDIKGKNVRKPLMRLLGYMLADGCFAPKNISWTKSEKAQQDDFLACVHALGDEITEYVPNFTFGIHGKDGCKNHIRTLLRKFDLLGKKSIEKHIPDIVFLASRNAISEFLSALYSGDGWVTQKEISISFSNEKLLRGVQFLLLRFGIVSTVREKRVKTSANNSWQLNICSGENLVRFAENISLVGKKSERIHEFLPIWKSMPCKSFIDRIPNELGKQLLAECRKFYKEYLGVSLYSQMKKVYSHLSYQLNKNCPTMRQSWCSLKHIPAVSQVFDDAIFWDEIVEIKSLGKIHTYDLTVDIYHNFVADNCLVHNTWQLLYTAFTALRQRCNVVFFSCGDMTENQMRLRIGHMLTGRDPKRRRDSVWYPILDCQHNQEGKCPLGEDTDSIYIGKGKERRKGNIDDLPDHEVCTRCRNDKGACRYFEGAVWHKIVVPAEVEKSRKDALEALKKRACGAGFKLFCNPPDTLTVEEINKQLDLLEEQEGFKPDVILIDYADLLATEVYARRLEYRHQINASWMAMRKLSQVRNCALITASQAKLGARIKGYVDQTDTSEDKRKLAHVTAMLALSQVPDEKRSGVLRVSNIAMRDGEFDKEKHAVVLQCLALGKPYLTSYLSKRLSRKRDEK